MWSRGGDENVIHSPRARSQGADGLSSPGSQDHGASRVPGVGAVRLAVIMHGHLNSAPIVPALHPTVLTSP